MGKVEVYLAGDLPGVGLVSTTGCTAEVYRHGAHVTSWQNADEEDIIFLSTKVVLKPPKAIRGGIPVCFPQFSDFGPLMQHGFARNEEWEVTAQTPDSVSMRLAASEASLALWPHHFVCTYNVALVEDQMVISFSVANEGTTAMTFTTALHTYFKVADASAARVEGLKGTKYLDSLNGRKKCTEAGDAVTFPEEVDRIYLNTPRTLSVVDVAGGRTISLTKTNLPDAVVWNPWIDKAKATADLGDEDYKVMVCVEAAAIETPVTVAPGATWRCGQTLSVASS